MRKGRFTIHLSRIREQSLRKRPNRALERVIQIRILPKQSLPLVGKVAGPVQLLALEFHIGCDIFLRRLEDGLCLLLPEILGNGIEPLCRRGWRRCRLSGLLLRFRP